MKTTGSTARPRKPPESKGPNSHPSLAKVRKSLRLLSSPSKARTLSGFFKTGPGQYGEGDRFIGVTQPELRRLAREFRALTASEHIQLLKSPIHEERMLALLIWTLKFKQANEAEQTRITRNFLKHWRFINNWDLIDVNTPHLVGPSLRQGDPITVRTLDRFIAADPLWKRRIALLATFHLISQGRFERSLRYAALVLRDPEDLIHKASGWMLREIGKRDLGELRKFLTRHSAHMPRTMLRYAIERLPPAERKRWMTPASQ